MNELYGVVVERNFKKFVEEVEFSGKFMLVQTCFEIHAWFFS